MNNSFFFLLLDYENWIISIRSKKKNSKDWTKVIYSSNNYSCWKQIMTTIGQIYLIQQKSVIVFPQNLSVLQILNKKVFFFCVFFQWKIFKTLIKIRFLFLGSFYSIICMWKKKFFFFSNTFWLLPLFFWPKKLFGFLINKQNVKWRIEKKKKIIECISFVSFLRCNLFFTF